MTVLFAEVAAPAGLAGTLGLEALRDLVGGSLATVIAEVEALGGTVTSVSGRGLQAMFGAPEAHEDDPERAVRAAYRAVSATAAAATAAARAAERRKPWGCGSASSRARPSSARSATAPRWSTPRSATWSASRRRCSPPPGPGSVLVGPATRAATAHLFSWGRRRGDARRRRQAAGRRLPGRPVGHGRRTGGRALAARRRWSAARPSCACSTSRCGRRSRAGARSSR